MRSKGRHTGVMNMPRFLCAFFAAALCVPLLAKDVNVKGYTRKDGTYVAPHVRSSPNSTKADNYSTKGNVNPNTGKAGTKSDDASKSANATSAAKPETAPVAVAKPEPVNLALVAAGMTKTQVIATIGKPNIESSTSWFYLDRGFVRFKGDLVTGVEARK